MRNRFTSRALDPNTTSHHLWHSSNTNLSQLCVFGSKLWYLIPKKKVKKLDPRFREAIMMGYPKQSKGYKLWEIDSSKLIVSRDVKLSEESGNDIFKGENS